LPEGQARPSTSTKYINGSEWLVPPPTPTPEIIKVIETQIVTKEVIKTVQVIQTPDYQRLEEIDKKSKYDVAIKIIGICGIILFGLYFIRVMWVAYKSD
jgi:hypothetical protein